MEPEAPKPMTELELLKMRMNKTTDESLESTRRMVQLCDESQKTGAATLEQLAAQGGWYIYVNLWNVVGAPVLPAWLETPACHLNVIQLPSCHYYHYYYYYYYYCIIIIISGQ
ncbi:hypothetical protein P879_07352 [Paragonimus westermani]|uniref:Synaptosomal-associated protein 25 n=1 Tax=Paragonimus westermani TaxID=34504 RepID=A0A8T0DDY6_9TREM|nr:hypothetical protein P879_07352 [Paragonimus westermani]